LLRYATTGRGSIFGKVFANGADATRTWALMQQVGTALPAAATPRPLAVSPDLGLVLFEPVPGRALDTLVGTPAMVGGLARAGAWLATLHAAACPLDRLLDLEHEAANAQVWSTVAAAAMPELADAATELADDVARSVPSPCPRVVPIHKDFHPQHVLVTADATVGVVDLDEARMGDPLFDVGHFLTNLALLGHRSRVDDAEQEAWTEAFLAGYGAALTDEGRLRWFRAYTCVKLAKQLATGQGPRPRPDDTGRAADMAWALRHGSAVLAP
jgi:aminoglycoside phosphotransferase (APT) family kinase protein